MSDQHEIPAGLERYSDAGAFLDLFGPLYARPDGALGVRVRPHHLNAAGTAMGGFLTTVADAALSLAIRRAADGDPAVATVSLTTDFLRPGPAGAWLEAYVTVEQLGGKLVFADCSVRTDDNEIMRARAVFAVRSDGSRTLPPGEAPEAIWIGPVGRNRSVDANGAPFSKALSEDAE